MSEPEAETVPELQRATSTAPIYFPVSLAKLAIMSIVTFGMYQPFWLFSQWYYIREREHRDLSLILRVFFAIFFCYPLFRRIRNTAQSEGIAPSFVAGPLAAGWVLFTLFRLGPSPFDLLFSVFSVLFLLPLQRTVNAINEAADPEHGRNDRFTGWNKAAIVIGGLLWLCLLVAVFFLPPEPVMQGR
jgi:hypothetical protein